MPERTSENGDISSLDNIGGHIDTVTFKQILEMDDDDIDRDFSQGLVFGFFDQAESTFKEMELSILNKDLAQLSSLGHFLKGSSATLGLVKVKQSCEKIQNLGAKKDEAGTKDIPNPDTCLQKITHQLAEMKVDYQEVKKYLKKFYDDEDEED